VLTIRGLDAGYGRALALRDVSLDVAAGGLTTVLGPNGAGKSTLLRAISGVVRARSGSIEFDGKRLDTMEAHDIVRLGVVHVPEGRQIFPDLSVAENLQLGAIAAGRPSSRPEVEEFIFTMFPRLKERVQQPAGTLSGGEQQMVAIGRGLASSPKLLLLDEPSLGLAPSVADQIFQRIEEIHRQDKLATVLVEQRVVEALHSCDVGYVLETGRVVLQGSNQTLLADDRVRKAYLGM
jgi:branched-chain amino acid transport system ATP-binding protein